MKRKHFICVCGKKKECASNISAEGLLNDLADTP